jgi:uncharacterized NAD(P)/FAD-binding protein YdhS
MQTIAIIGAGLRGTLCFINLIHKRTQNLRIFLVDKKEKSGPLSASEFFYNQQNLPIGQLSAFQEQSNHFHTWLQAQGYSYQLTEVAPYQLYCAYIETLHQQALALQSKSLDIHLLDDEAVDILILRSKAFTKLKSGTILMSDKTILATGGISAPMLQDSNTPLVRNMYLNGFLSMDSETRQVRIDTDGSLIDAKGNSSAILYSLSTEANTPLPALENKANYLALLAGFNINNAFSSQA